MSLPFAAANGGLLHEPDDVCSVHPYQERLCYPVLHLRYGPMIGLKIAGNIPLIPEPGNADCDGLVGRLNLPLPITVSIVLAGFSSLVKPYSRTLFHFGDCYALKETLDRIGH
jgi:hypothetical protein